MLSIDLTLHLSDELARKAKKTGVLKPEIIIQLIEQEVIRRQQLDYLLEKMDALAALDLPPLTVEEIEHEIQAVRRERRR